jgi:hypothetical protein
MPRKGGKGEDSIIVATAKVWEEGGLFQTTGSESIMMFEKSNHVVVVSFCAHHNIYHPKSNRPLIPREGFKWEIIYSVWFSGVWCMCVSRCVCKFV